jgi:polyisoprenyl-teichoic acid--peptidoglycan teichoic acid transferase
MATEREVSTGQKLRRRKSGPLSAMVSVMLVVALVGTVSLMRAVDARSASIERVEGLSESLAEMDLDSRSLNYLLVGSDSREGVAGSEIDLPEVGTTADVQGQRADVIMILRREADGGLALLSLPRDLWVPIAGTGGSDRINAAYGAGPERLVRTISASLGVPIHHYLEVNFLGFTRIIDATGGVPMCFDYATRDRMSGFNVQPGCQNLSGRQALAFSRSRSYEEFRDGRWQMDPTGDIGRIRRQQLFMRAAINGALVSFRDSPLSSGTLIDSVLASLKIDEGLDPYRAASSLRRAAQDDLVTLTLDTRPERIDGKSVLILEPSATAVLDYFAGKGPLPTPDG